MPTGILGDQSLVTTIARKYFAVTAAMGAAAQVIQTGPAGLYALINSGAPQANALTVYDATTGDTLSAANQVWSGSLGQGQVVTLGLQLTRGLTVQMAGAAGANVLVTFA